MDFLELTQFCNAYESGGRFYPADLPINIKIEKSGDIESYQGYHFITHIIKNTKHEYFKIEQIAEGNTYYGVGTVYHPPEARKVSPVIKLSPRPHVEYHEGVSRTYRMPTTSPQQTQLVPLVGMP